MIGEPGYTSDRSVAALTSSLQPMKAGHNTDWNLSTAWTDIDAVRRIYSDSRTRYNDIKKILVSSGIAGSSIDLKLDLSKGGSRVWLCQLAGGLTVSKDINIYIYICISILLTFYLQSLTFLRIYIYIHSYIYFYIYIYSIPTTWDLC